MRLNGPSYIPSSVTWIPAYEKAMLDDLMRYIFHDFWAQVAIVALCQALRDVDNAMVESYEDGLRVSARIGNWVKPR